MNNDTSRGAAIVTGAGRGLGLGIAHSLARAGRPVVLAARTAGELRHAAAAIAAAGHEALDVPTDVGDEAQVERLVAFALERFGDIDVVVANAGAVPVVRHLDEVSWDQWRRGIDVDVRGLFNTTRAVLPHLRSRGHGTIVVVAAARGGTISTPLHAAVSPGQAALVSLARCIRSWVEPDGIAVHCLYPRITTAGAVGLAGAAAFGAETGVSADEWIRRRFGDDDAGPDAVGTAVVALTREVAGGEWEVAGQRLKPSSSA
jgi:NAD(P)-dependent dehydrogenase (short-subunit alcohol dehydrogenase family)